MTAAEAVAWGRFQRERRHHKASDLDNGEQDAGFIPIADGCEHQSDAGRCAVCGAEVS